MLYVNIAAWLLLIALPCYGLRGRGGVVVFVWLYAMLFGIAISVLQPLFFGLADGRLEQAGMLQLIVYLVLCAGAFPLAAFTTRFVQINIDPFDWMLGIVFGIAAAITICHFALGSLILAVSGTPLYTELMHAFVVRQAVFFDAWHSLVNIAMHIDQREVTAPQ